MVRNSRGFLSGNTRKLRKKKKYTINDIIKSFSVGDRVIIVVKPVRKGSAHLRYQGRMGIIAEKRNKGYVVSIKDGGKHKKIVATALHLMSAESKR